MVTESTHVLFIDSDMRFPPDTIERLLQHEVAIVGANCSTRDNTRPTARKDGAFLSSIGKNGIEEVDMIGFGVTMIRVDMFRSLPPPWFVFQYDGERCAGEDVFFCQKAKKAGHSIWVDHDLSALVKHTGAVEHGVK